MEHGPAYGKIVTHILPATLVGLVAAAAASRHHLRRRKTTQPSMQDHIIPLLVKTDSGRHGDLERFCDYVARQIGFVDASEHPQLRKLANDYLKKSDGYDENIFEYFSNEPDADSLYVKLMEEIERCILSYFAFHWSKASRSITLVMSDESVKKPKLKDFVMAATRKQRFARVTKDLKVTRVFSTLVEELKAIGCDAQSNCTDVMVPAAHSERSPVLLLMGGGMGAGKSTVLKDIKNDSFWLGAATKAVYIEADAFKETDVIYRAISSSGHHNDMIQTAELVHQSSTDAASSLLVTALNEGRDVIMDGTLSWEPFVEQTIAMARNVHKHRYRMGVGYKVAEDGTINENYWEQLKPDEEQYKQVADRKPYRIELVGVVCDAYMAVVRGIRRAVMVKRAVRVKSQLDSHKRFASAFPRYSQLVDLSKLYCTNANSGPPKLIAWKEGENNLLIDPDEIDCLTTVTNINTDAESIYELYADKSRLYQPGSVWYDVVLTPSRSTYQLELKTAIQNIEKGI